MEKEEMSYEEFVEEIANSKFYGYSISIRGNFKEALMKYSKEYGMDKVSNDAEIILNEIKNKAKQNREDNTEEYELAEKKYQNLVNKYAKEGIPCEKVLDSEEFREVAKSGVDVSKFQEDVTNKMEKDGICINEELKPMLDDEMDR